jgi:predicted Rossmann fold flavoprotein
LKNYDIVVVGAGPAGLIAAARAAQLGKRVLLIEKMSQPGRKLLITGKGRCNITNDAPISEFIKHIKPNGRFLKFAFSQFFSKDIIEILNLSGVETVVERGGRLFPASNKAADVLQALLSQAQKAGVEIYNNCPLERILCNENGICGVEILNNNRLEQVETSKLILCTGGKSYPATGSTGDGFAFAEKLGHKIVPLRPSLVPLVTSGDLAEKLQGLSLKNVKAVVWVNGKKAQEDFGEMLFTHFGLSGPIILSLSRLVVDELQKRSTVELSIDLKPALDDLQLDARLLRDLNEHGKMHLDNIAKLWLPAKLIPIFLDLCGLKPDKDGNQVTSAERKKIRLIMKDLRFTVKGNRSFKEAIITAGGVATEQIDAKTMESKLVKGLYFAGEIIDLDADTGGFNLQIAYSTAWVAASAAAI